VHAQARVGGQNFACASSNTMKKVWGNRGIRPHTLNVGTTMVVSSHFHPLDALPVGTQYLLDMKSGHLQRWSDGDSVMESIILPIA